MTLSKKEFDRYIKQFQFRELFNTMGWNNDKTTQHIVVDEETHTLKAVAQKSGFKILVCDPLHSGLLPDYSTRKKIETKVTKLFQEHLIIFCDKNQTEQVWQLVVRQTGKPAKVTETRWHIDQAPELLYQRAAGMFFKMEEEDKITIVDVTSRVGANFQQNNERVTKQFYDKFKKEHTSFISFITGIEEKTNQQWYASLMLNRLMFCYFIQKKGFLDKNINYLRDKLTACQEKKGKGKFYSFYRNFLLVLFHKGLNEPERGPKVKIEIGEIPYLNGGLFDEHELEKANTSIDIDDIAFERLFDFFDEYEWHLDTRTAATGKDINPDVIGYIFEKYINDRANMGAYYTKEDITDYISKNCILPYLFDETKRNYAKAFTPDGEVWKIVKESGDQYIYEAVKKGLPLPLPEEIEQGIKEISKRTEWNKPANSEYALPTEIWREVVERRKRYTEVKNKIDNGEVTAINDFITHNLNIRQFAQDTIESTNDPEFVKHFYKALTSVTIIDPTCGSGAFLFAAMNILESLYEACIQRMRAFVEDEDRLNETDKKSFRHKFKYFRDVLEETQNEQHPNLQYFIYKSIILRNLYGVDIMKEAVEIAKLRLFLKLVATVEPNYKKPNFGLEPLPDIDFNIRAGNTLVGFATEEELANAFSGTMDFDNSEEKLKEKCETVAKAFEHYKEIQLTSGDDFKNFKEAKEALNARLKELNHELNQLLHKQATLYKYEDWLVSHKPFHWFAEFYEIIHGRGGFDVVIGNPPYVEYSKIKKNYLVKGYETEKCGNLYAFVMEVATKIISKNGKLGVIIPLASFSTKRMSSLQKLYLKLGNNIFISNYEATSNPTTLFIGVKVQLSIILWDRALNKKSSSNIFTTAYRRCYSYERPYLLDNFTYTKAEIFEDYITRIKNPIEVKILIKLFKDKKIANFSGSKGVLYYRNMGNFFFKIAFKMEPKYYKNGKMEKSSTVSVFSARSKKESLALISLINSTLFYYYWIIFSDCYHLSKGNINDFPFDLSKLSSVVLNDLSELAIKYTNSLEVNAIWQIENTKDGSTKKYRRYFPQNSKIIANEIDTVLAEHYGFTDEELDFIINYDIKYRMGKELGNADEE